MPGGEKATISNTNFATKEVKYHNNCRLRYQKVAEHTPIALEEKTSENTDGSMQTPVSSCNARIKKHT